MPVEKAPARNGGLPALNAAEEIRHSEPRTKLFFGNASEGEGDMFLTNQRIVWLSNADGTQGYAIDYPFVAVHAVSRDPASWPEPCLYCQLRTEGPEGDIDEDEEDDIPEVRFVPAAAGNLQRVFMVFSEMSALNPDPMDDDDNGSLSGSDDGGAALLASVWNAKEDDAAMEDAEEDDDDSEQPVFSGVCMG